MKKLFFLIITGIIIFQFNISAQQANEKDFYWKKVEKFTKMKNAGVGLTIGGAVLTVIGVGLIANSVETETNSYGYTSEPNEDKLMMGVVAVELGVGMTAGGIVLWAIGGSKRNKYMTRMKSLSLNLNPDSRQKLTLSYKF